MLRFKNYSSLFPFPDLVEGGRAGGDEVAEQGVVHVQRPRRRQLHPRRESVAWKAENQKLVFHVVAVFANQTNESFQIG